jgi:hypothetical protein
MCVHFLGILYLSNSICLNMLQVPFYIEFFVLIVLHIVLICACAHVHANMRGLVVEGTRKSS